MLSFPRISLPMAVTALGLLIPISSAAGQELQSNQEVPTQSVGALQVPPNVLNSNDLPDAPDAEATASSADSGLDLSDGQAAAGQNSNQAPGQGSGHQTKRILFIVPNFRSVSADQKLPPMTVKDKAKLFFSDTFDYSGFIEVGLIAGSSDWHKSEPEFGHGAVAYGRYYWHGLADTTDGNLMTEFLVPVAAHEDPRFYTLGHGSIWKRSIYSVGRLAITRSDNGHETVNLAEIVGNGAASGISNFYYPRGDRDWTKTGQRWVLQVGIDGVSNLVKEFWPDINDHLFHNKY